MKINLVKQTTEFNCGSACLAMILDMSPAEVEEKVLKRKIGELYDTEETDENLPIGVTAYEIQAALYDYGYYPYYIHVPCKKVGDNWFHRIGDQLPLLKSLERIERHIYHQRRPAILGVDSLKYKGGSHWIVVNNRRLYDPADYEHTYQHLSDYNAEHQLKISEAILILEEGP